MVFTSWLIISACGLAGIVIARALRGVRRGPTPAQVRAGQAFRALFEPSDEDLADAIADQEHREALADFDRRLGVTPPAPSDERTLGSMECIKEGDTLVTWDDNGAPIRTRVRPAPTSIPSEGTIVMGRTALKPQPQMPGPVLPRKFDC